MMGHQEKSKGGRSHITADFHFLSIDGDCPNRKASHSKGGRFPFVARPHVSHTGWIWHLLEKVAGRSSGQFPHASHHDDVCLCNLCGYRGMSSMPTQMTIDAQSPGMWLVSPEKLTIGWPVWQMGRSCKFLVLICDNASTRLNRDRNTLCAAPAFRTQPNN